MTSDKPRSQAGISPARAAAFEILLHAEREKSYASELLHSSRYARLSPSDHGLATEIVMGVLRWQSVLDSEIAHFSSQKIGKLDSEVLISLRLAAYQMLFLDRIPARAAINESVELVKRARKRSAAPFVNALLRKISQHEEWKAERREIDEAHLNPQGIANQLAHPDWLVRRWTEKYGIEAAYAICRHDQKTPVTAIHRLADDVAQKLKASGITLIPGALLSSAQLVSSGDVTSTGLFREGSVIIQDEASQLVALLAGRGSRILDCCAAPGGKTRVLAQQNPDASILAADLHPHRARLMRRLVADRRVAIIAADARALPLSTTFDLVLVDAPCSGTGTLARNPEIKWRLRPEDLIDLQSRQIAILASAMKLVAPGGRLIYSTCSLEPEENSGVVESVLRNDGSFQLRTARLELERLRAEDELVWQDLDSLTDGSFVRTIPGVHPCDGFFAAILEKI